MYLWTLTTPGRFLDTHLESPRIMPEMPGSVSRLFGVAVVFLAGGCASTSNLEVEMSRMRRELAQTKKELADTQLAVQRLDSQVTILSLGREQVDRAPTTRVAGASARPRDGGGSARPESKVAGAGGKSAVRRSESTKGGNPVLPVVRMTNKAEPEAAGQDESWVEAGALDDGSPPIMIQLKGNEESGNERLPVDHDVLKKPDPVLAKKARAPAESNRADVETEYANALAKLRNDHDPEAALALFEAFRERHPRSPLADNAGYWSAECHYALKAYARAIAGFERLVKERPHSQKQADALLRIAESWNALSEPGKAKPVLEQIISEYPKSEAAARARVALDTLGK